MASETADDDDDELMQQIDLRTALLLGVPVLAIAGCVYFVGFFSTAGMPYFTLLELQDFVVAAAKTIPPVLAYVVLLFFISGVDTRSKVRQHYNDLTEGKTPQEALELIQDDDKVYSPDDDFKFFDWAYKDKDGNWSDEKILNWKGFNYIWTTVWFIVVGLCIFGFQVPVILVVISGILFTGTFSVVVQYYWYRFDVDLHIYQVWFIQIMTVIFIWGIWDARAEQSSEKPRYSISVNQIESTTSSFRRVGGNILFFDQQQKGWRIVQREGATITRRFKLKDDETTDTVVNIDS